MDYLLSFLYKYEKKKISVVKPSLPDIEDSLYLEQIWDAEYFQMVGYFTKN